MGKGIIIEFEGLDASFKETNSKSLYNKLKDTYPDREVILTHYPRYESSSSYFIKQYLSGKYGKVSEIDYELSHMMYALDMYDDWMVTLKEKYENGAIIIFDRYVISNVIYNVAKRQGYLSVEECYRLTHEQLFLNYCKLELPNPDIVIYMHMPYEKILETIQKRNEKDGIESDTGLLRDVYYMYTDEFMFSNIHDTEIFNIPLSGTVNRKKVIECCDGDIIRSKEEIANDIESFVLPFIKRRIK